VVWSKQFLQSLLFTSNFVVCSFSVTDFVYTTRTFFYDVKYFACLYFFYTKIEYRPYRAIYGITQIQAFRGVRVLNATALFLAGTILPVTGTPFQFRLLQPPEASQLLASNPVPPPETESQEERSCSRNPEVIEPNLVLFRSNCLPFAVGKIPIFSCILVGHVSVRRAHRSLSGRGARPTRRPDGWLRLRGRWAGPICKWSRPLLSSWDILRFCSQMLLLWF